MNDRAYLTPAISLAGGRCLFEVTYLLHFLQGLRKRLRRRLPTVVVFAQVGGTSASNTSLDGLVNAAALEAILGQLLLHLDGAVVVPLG